MALYDDRLADLSEARRKPLARNPLLRRGASEAARRPSMSAQSLLFDRDAGWTESKAKAWAKSHGYRYGKVDVTDRYIRIRQFDPKGSKVKRTIPFGRGIRAVVAREESSNMARTSTVKSPRRKRRTAKKKTSHRRRRRVHAVAAPRKRRHRRAKKAAATTRRRRRRTVRVEAKRSRRRRSSMVMAPRRRRRRVTREAWKGDPEGHAKAARKGHRRRKARKTTRRHRRRKTREAVMESPRRRRRHRRARETVMEAPRRRRRRHHVYASRRSGGMGVGEMVLATASAGFGFILADGIDRLLATYNPSSTDAPPKDKFTSSGTGTLANTLNVASMPDWKRLVAGVGLTAAPAVGAMFTDGYARSALEGAAIGAGVNFIKMLVNNVLMPMLIGKDTSAPALQKSYIARLYPAEVAAHINKASSQPAPGALSGAQDVGPFALGGDSPYPTAEQALRAGVSGDSPYPTAEQALRSGVSGDSPYPTAAQALRKEAGVSAWEPSGPSTPGPGPQDNGADCGCVGDPTIGYASFLGTPEEDATS